MQAMLIRTKREPSEEHAETEMAEFNDEIDKQE
jgi:hypothetical protein